MSLAIRKHFIHKILYFNQFVKVFTCEISGSAVTLVLCRCLSNGVCVCVCVCVIIAGGEKATGGGRESGSDAWKQYMRRSTWFVHTDTYIHIHRHIHTHTPSCSLTHLC